MRIYLTYLLIAASALCQAQNGDNPFEIQYHKNGRTVEVDTLNRKPEAESNIFDIERTTTSEIVVETVQTEKDFQEEPVKETTTTKTETNIETKVVNEKENNQNPFEVSHIPIRKSKLKEEVSTIKEQISSSSNSTTDNFIFWLILFSSVLIAIVINTKRTVIPKVLMSVTNINILKYNKREERGGFSGQYILLYLVYLINGGVFLYLLLKELSDDLGPLLFYYCIGGVLILYLVKHLGLKIFGLIFPVGLEINVFNFSIQVYNIILGLVLVPINLLVGFGPIQTVRVFLYLGVATVLLLFILRSIRGLLIAKKYIVKNTFHIFLYLCSSEITPILLFIKLI